MTWIILFLAISFFANDSLMHPDCSRSSDCKTGWSCDHVANICRHPKTKCDDIKDCPEGATCDPADNMCFCKPQTPKCDGCNPGFHCNQCHMCVQDTLSTTKAVATCVPSCQPPQVCDKGVCSKPKAHKIACNSACDVCNACGRDLYVNATSVAISVIPPLITCDEDCEAPLVCDAVANMCRNPKTREPICNDKECPHGAHCAITPNMCECNSITKDEECPKKGCPDGSHCNLCNICQSDTTAESTTEISTTISGTLTCDLSCEPPLVCDAVANMCRNPQTREPICNTEKDCPFGARCMEPTNMCECNKETPQCPKEDCPDDKPICNRCNKCEEGAISTTTPAPCCPSCKPPFVCDTVAKTCSDPRTRQPSTEVSSSTTEIPDYSACGTSCQPPLECDEETKECRDPEAHKIACHFACNVCAACEYDPPVNAPHVAPTPIAVTMPDPESSGIPVMAFDVFLVVMSLITCHVI